MCKKLLIICLTFFLLLSIPVSSIDSSAHAGVSAENYLVLKCGPRYPMTFRRWGPMWRMNELFQSDESTTQDPFSTRLRTKYHTWKLSLALLEEAFDLDLDANGRDFDIFSTLNRIDDVFGYPFPFFLYGDELHGDGFLERDPYDVSWTPDHDFLEKWFFGFGIVIVP